MGREWDRKRKIDELLNDNSLTPEMKKDLEAKREKQRSNWNESKLETGAIGYFVSPPTLSSEGTSSGQQ